jgi:hypothetical protein
MRLPNYYPAKEKAGGRLAGLFSGPVRREIPEKHSRSENSPISSRRATFAGAKPSIEANWRSRLHTFNQTLYI